MSLFVKSEPIVVYIILHELKVASLYYRPTTCKKYMYSNTSLTCHNHLTKALPSTTLLPSMFHHFISTFKVQSPTEATENNVDPGLIRAGLTRGGSVQLYVLTPMMYNTPSVNCGTYLQNLPRQLIHCRDKWRGVWQKAADLAGVLAQ